MKNCADVTKPALMIIKIDQTGHMRLPDRWQSDAVSGMSDKIVACGSQRLMAVVSSANPVRFDS